MGEARELMDRVTDAVSSGNPEALREVYAPDVVATTPDWGELHGVDQLIDWIRTFNEAFSDLRFESMKYHETSDTAIDQGDLIATHTNALRLPDGQTIPPTGKQVRIREVDVATASGGRIVRHDFYFDQLEMLTQLGLMEAPAVSKP